jgi:hypothetical protein
MYKYIRELDPLPVLFSKLVYFEAGKTSCISGSSRDRSVTVPETPGVTHEQYQATVAAARERMAELKRLEAVG